MLTLIYVNCYIVFVIDPSTWKLEAKTKTDVGLSFKSTAVHNTDNGKLLGTLESEYSCKDYGICIAYNFSLISFDGSTSRHVDMLRFRFEVCGKVEHR